MPDQSSAATEHAIIQEITGPLETLPDDPVALVHAEFPTAMRGYDRAAVDDYMQQMSRLVAELQATRSPEAAVRRALERVGEQISGILQRAHETAEQITAQSRREAEDRLEHARAEAAQIAGAAEQRVKDLDGDTDRIWVERQRIVSDAEELAEQLVALAKSAVDRFPPDEDSDDVEDRTAPYDDDSVPTVAGPPTFLEETPAGDEEAEHAPPDEAAPSADDDEEAPSPYEDRAEATEAAPYVDAGDEEEEEEEEEDFFDDEEPDPAFDDVEKTVAFRPLAPSEPDPGSTPGAEDEPAEPTDQASSTPEGGRPEPAPEADGESTAIIPPASQAANRRRRS